VDGVILRHRAEQAVELAERREVQDRDLKDWADWLARMPG
jgi:hypothetical protein